MMHHVRINLKDVVILVTKRVLHENIRRQFVILEVGRGPLEDLTLAVRHHYSLLASSHFLPFLAQEFLGVIVFLCHRFL